MRREYGLDKRICCICRSLPFDTPELAKLLGIIPKTRPKNIPPGTKFMSIDEMMTTLDQDGDGLILLAILALSPHLPSSPNFSLALVCPEETPCDPFCRLHRRGGMVGKFVEMRSESYPPCPSSFPRPLPNHIHIRPSAPPFPVPCAASASVRVSLSICCFSLANVLTPRGWRQRWPKISTTRESMFDSCEQPRDCLRHVVLKCAAGEFDGQQARQAGERREGGSGGVERIEGKRRTRRMRRQ